ncbi:MAG: STAS domain-containing protein, partial [Syntrophobacterales bacterium]
MEVVEKKQNGICILGLLGRLDSNTSPEFEKKIFEVIEDGTKSLIVDFESLDYISSAGLRVLLKATKE